MRTLNLISVHCLTLLLRNQLAYRWSDKNDLVVHDDNLSQLKEINCINYVYNECTGIW